MNWFCQTAMVNNLWVKNWLKFIHASLWIQDFAEYVYFQGPLFKSDFGNTYSLNPSSGSPFW
jgi:hypothetical protein